MGTTIHALAYRVSMDTRQFTQGSVATKKELREAAKITDQYRSAIDKAEEELVKLHTMEAKGLITKKQLRSEIAKVTQSYNDSHAAMGRFRTGLKGIASAKNAIGALGIGAAVKTATSFATKNLEDMDRMIKKSRQIGMDANDLARLTYAVGMNTTMTEESLVSSLEKFAKGMSEARNGTGPVLDALEQMNLSIDDFADKSTLQSIYLIADAMSTISDEQDQFNLSTKLFGKSGGDMVSLLANGSAEISKMADEADRFGKSWDQDMNKGIEETNDQITRMKEEWAGMARELSIAAIPAIQATTAVLRDLATGIKLAAMGRLFGTPHVGMADSIKLTPEEIGVRSQYLNYRQRYTGSMGGLTTREEYRLNQGANAEEQARIANEMLKEIREMRRISESQALTYDARQGVLQ